MNSMVAGWATFQLYSSYSYGIISWYKCVLTVTDMDNNNMLYVHVICAFLYFMFHLLYVKGNIIRYFWAAGRRPYIVFTFTGSVWNVRNNVNIYIYMSTTWRTRSRYKIFQLYFGESHSFAPDFISEGSFRPEEFFEILF